METIIVTVIVIYALYFIIKKFIKEAAGKTCSDCNGKCKNCISKINM